MEQERKWDGHAKEVTVCVACFMVGLGLMGLLGLSDGWFVKPLSRVIALWGLFIPYYYSVLRKQRAVRLWKLLVLLAAVSVLLAALQVMWDRS